MESRRSFIKKSLISGGLMMAGGFPYEAFASQEIRFTILHTNDVHSRLEPFPRTDKNFSGMGGVARRASLIEQIRREEKHVLLFDAGDIFQGTPYFNLYKGEPEIKAMSMMGYDACTMGNHDFDAGVEGFAKQLVHADFPVLIANYDFDRTILKGKTEPYKIFKIEGLKIGVFGLGIQLMGLVPKEAFGRTWYHDALEIGINTSEMLKKKKGCDMVVCLSHLGFEYSTGKVSDKVLARESTCIDLIIGGHTHTFLEEPFIAKNKENKDVIINQVGWAGLRLGRLDFVYSLDKKIYLSKSNTVVVGKQTRA